MSHVYEPSFINDEELRKEAARLQSILSGEEQYLYMTILHAALKRMKPGMIVYADGSDLDLGAGAGLYRRDADNNTWIPLSGSVIGRAYSEYTSNTALSATIPIDDTIPQVTEGTEVLSVSITPKSVHSRIRLRFQSTGSCNGSNAIVAAIFANGAANAIAASAVVVWAANVPAMINLEKEIAPGSTSAQTYSVRVGPNTGVMRLNGRSDGRYLGGVQAATLIAEEIV